MAHKNKVKRANSEKRRSRRYVCTLEGDCFVVSAHETISRWPGRIESMSLGGIRMVLGRRFEPGTLLGIELLLPNSRATRIALVRVVRVYYSGCHWHLGCCWVTGLPSDELLGLLGGNFVQESARELLVRAA